MKMVRLLRWTGIAAMTMTMTMTMTMAMAPAPPPRDWAAVLRQDVQAFHDDIAANHAGPVDRLNKRFSALNDAALVQALTRSRQVADYPGYLWAMRGFVARFDDGHVQLGEVKGAEPIQIRWPGFLTAYDDHGAAIVRVRADDAPVPVGATLVGCDGRSAEALGRDTVGAFFGRWFLASQRMNQGWRLFVDARNPFVTRAARCTFRVDGKPVTVPLTWRSLPDAEWSRRVGAVTRAPRAPIAARTLADGTRWYAISSFDGDPSSSAGTSLPPLIAGIAADRTALSAAPRIVLDLRGNGGGSSDWSRQIAVILWGEAALARAEQSKSYVEWRASPANIAFMKAALAERSAVPQPREVTDWFNKAIAGMSTALAAGKPLWREADDPAAPTPSPVPPAPTPLRTPVYFVTDPACGSACLDAADLWAALGAIQVGTETAADTLYMDVRDVTLPSGVAEVAVPMKVYRDRPRGSNVPLMPRYRYAGDMRDTDGLERWIASLPRIRS